MIRTCVACRRAQPAERLVRLVLDPEGTAVVGRTLPGRGAWIGPHRSCLEEAMHRGAFSRAFRATVEPDGFDGVLENWDGPPHPPTWCPLA